MESFISGSSREGLAVLEPLAARMFFPFVVERWIESRHALAKRFFVNAPNATALHLGFRFVLPQVKDIILNAAFQGSFKTLAECCAQAKTANTVVRKMGLYGHPGIQELLARSSLRELNRSLRPDVVK
eukprot:6763048-Pyramimonas_sp.AAC.1